MMWLFSLPLCRLPLYHLFVIHLLAPVRLCGCLRVVADSMLSFRHHSDPSVNLNQAHFPPTPPPLPQVRAFCARLIACFCVLPEGARERFICPRCYFDYRNFPPFSAAPSPVFIHFVGAGSVLPVTVCHGQ